MKALYFLLVILLMSSACPKKKKQGMFPFGAWMHSHEEDKDPNAEWLQYRPSTFAFPPARGRSGFIVLKDGRFALLGPSPSDTGDTIWGSWKKEADGKLSLFVSGIALKSLAWKTVGKEKLLVTLK